MKEKLHSGSSRRTRAGTVRVIIWHSACRLRLSTGFAAYERACGLLATPVPQRAEVRQVEWNVIPLCCAWGQLKCKIRGALRGGRIREVQGRSRDGR
jgi:hypothetical protein